MGFLASKDRLREKVVESQAKPDEAEEKHYSCEDWSQSFVEKIMNS